VRSVLLDTGRPYACWTLLALNLIYFAVGAAYSWQHEGSPIDYLSGRDSQTLYDLGGLVPNDTIPPAKWRALWRPQYERFVLFLFLHVGALHLILNMFFLVTLGGEIEAMWGWVRFLAIYFISGFVSGCVIILISRYQHTVSLTIGASGALYGLFVSMIVWFAMNYRHLPDNVLQDWSRAVGINIFLLLATNFIRDVSWEGHFGGAVGGLLAALLLHVQRYHPSRIVRWLALAGVPMIPAAFFVAVLWQAGWF
jgi:membrane associated rhomboid family serine protease